jgi:hypothetical protein
VIIKESWLTKARRNEAKMFMEVDGSFGVPRVLCSGHGRGEYDAPRSKLWALWDKESPVTVPEQRRLS